jgi:Calcineurin-like phosphoesterase
LKNRLTIRIYFTRLFTLVFPVLFSGVCLSQGFNTCDGPYIFYQQNHLIIKSLQADLTPVTESFDTSARTRQLINVHFSNHKDWDFGFYLKDHLENERAEWNTNAKTFAVSDIEGEFDHFRDLLMVAGVMDSDYAWTFGPGQLVICGDLFDRGKDVVPELWLLYKLEGEAKIKGGYVHVILGNHDIMNLSGDYRYVQKKYFQSAAKMSQKYKNMYGSDTELGRWLRSKNIIEKIGENLFMHAGMSPEALSLKKDISYINQLTRRYYDRAESQRVLQDLILNAFMGESGLFWYRGYFIPPRAEQSTVDSTVSFYGCNHIVVGHTITSSNIASYYGAMVIGIDVNEHEGDAQGLLIDHGQFQVIHKDGTSSPVPGSPLNFNVE